ncbi:MAG: signal peptidase I [Planctomycetota bacterium]
MSPTGSSPGTAPAKAAPTLLRRLLIGTSPKRTLICTVIIATVLIVVCKFLFLPARVQGDSMEPTCHNGSFILINTLRYSGDRTPARGDIVAVRLTGSSIMFLKRVLALPGDTFEFQSGRLLLNGTVAAEPYTLQGGAWTMPPTIVPPGSYFIAGDNRSMPMEFHTLGYATRDQIAGGLLF